jgi:hypothetical protein
MSHTTKIITFVAVVALSVFMGHIIPVEHPHDKITAVVTEAVITMDEKDTCIFLENYRERYCYGVSVKLSSSEYTCVYTYNGPNHDWARSILDFYPVGHSFEIRPTKLRCKRSGEPVFRLAMSIVFFMVLMFFLVPVFFGC